MDSLEGSATQLWLQVFLPARTYLVPVEERGHQIAWNYNYRWLSTET
ncbi:hypothetical protein LEMLEM_LOCUS12574 [Lemmus lemmus]